MSKPKTLDLVGLSEAASTLGTTTRQMLAWSRRKDFPKPVPRLQATVWHRADVKRWGEERV